MVTILRKKDSVQFIGKMCPSLVETRWIYLYEILEFFETYEDDILAIAFNEEMDINMKELMELYALITPLRRFVEKIETNYSICCVGKYIKELLSYYKPDQYELIEDIFKDFYIILISRLKSNNLDIVLTAYFLSQEGREDFRRLNRSSVSIFIPNETQYKYPPSDKQTPSDNVHQFLEEAMNKVESEILDTSLIDGEDGNDDSHLHQSFKQIYSDLIQKEFNEILNIHLFANMNVIAESVINSLAITLEIEYSEESFHALLDDWAFKPTNELPFYFDMKIQNPVNLWKRILTYENWKDLANIAIRIFSIGTSEANCERFISRQRDITGNHGINFSTEIMEARIRVNSSSDLVEMNKL